MRKSVVAVLLACVTGLMLCSCGQGNTTSAPAASASSDQEASEDTSGGSEEPEETEDSASVYIPVMAKGFQHQFWQAVRAGSEAAAKDLNVEMFFDGPESETDIDAQVEMMKSEMEKNPKAIALAALSTEAVTDLLKECREKGIPVIGFDSGVPNDTSGAVIATAATDNETAAAIAADKFGENEAIVAAMESATPDSPVVIAVLSQEATSASIMGRTSGFVNRMAEIAEGVQPGLVSIEGHSKWENKVDGAAVIIHVEVSETTEVESVEESAEKVLGMSGLTALFCSNEGTVNGFLAATSDGEDLAEGGKYHGITVAGFDAGAGQKNAIRKGYFLGSVTQDPYSIGYNAVDMAYKAAMGESVEDLDTGAKWYDASNIDDEDIALLVYD